MGSFQGHAHSFDAEAGHLNQGFHTLHVQVVDTAGVYSPVLTLPFFHVKDKNVVAVRYWFDNDTEHTVRLDYAGDNLLLDVSALEPGLHNLYLQIEDADGVLSDVEHRGFYRQMRRNALTWTYWFDDDESLMTTLPYPGESVMVDISELSEGFHTMHNIVNDITQSPVETRMFVKVPQTEGIGYMNCICSVDGKLVAQEQLPTRGGLLEWTLDVDSLGVGIHKAMFQVITPSGAASSIAERYFVREVTNRELGTMKCLYAIDGHQTYVQAGTMSNGLFHFDLNVDSLEDGLHRIAYMLVSDNGIVTPQKTAFFWKTPLGGSGITQYEYWLNRSENKHVIKLDKRTNPFSLISLLPVEAEPIRSSCFHFEVKQGVPMMYAKNDFHIAFYDVTGRRVDKSEQYVDYTVQQVVDDIAELQTTQTFERPAENGIKWFSFDAEYGDSIALKSNQPTSIQVFDAKGKEVYATSADKSVRFGGCHLLTNGTCYVAVHDVTGTGSQLTLQTQRIDKFAVFDFTPNKLASAGYTLMYFDGNGMDFVKKVELTNGDITLEADTLLASTQNLLARFHLQENYDNSKLFTLKVFFDKEDTGEQKTLTFDNAVVLEAVDNKPQMTVEITSERRVADPYPIKVVVKNEGNMPQYGIPLNVAFDNVEKFDDLAFVDFDLILSDELYESRDFFTYTDNLVGTGKKGYYMPLLIPYIGPYEERTFTFGVRTRISHARFNFYAWTGDPWYDATMDIGVVSQAVARAPQARCEQSNIHRVYDLFGLIDNVASFLNLSLSPATPVRMAVGTGEAIAGVQQGLSRTVEDATFDAYGIDPSERDQYRFQYRYCVRCPRDIWEDASPLQAPARVASATINSTTGSSSWEPIDDYASSDCPKPDPHLVDVYIPGDPNEMTGYSAPSGSRHMSDEVKTIGYDIEFENDPEIANSAAHCIVIENQLDPTKFDLKTFTPKDITLSGKKVELNGSKSFVQTLDLRPEIDAIAELQCAYNVQTGLIRWTFTSLDPMSMEPTDDIMQGVLPVNYDGTSGIGNVTYTVDLLKTFPDGTEISNKASIIFDNNDAIEPPVWTNTIDAVCPEGRVTGAVLTNDSTATIRCEGSDERSGVWKYEVYVQYGSGELWEKVGECPADSAEVSFRVYDGMDYGFCALAVDSAGNVEVKEMAREASLGTYLQGDANADGIVDIEDVVNATRYFLGETEVIYFKAADVTADNQIDIEDVVGIRRIFLTQPTTLLKAPVKRQRLRELLQQP
ncbi:MAG: dockerin type I repeat-containing protein [Bacteroidales bacterium]|nr:dockerin type I repeat-containing protein [Bacteroidales bacterium]